MMPWIAFLLPQHGRDFLARYPIQDWMPSQPWARTTVTAIAAAMTAAIVVLGIRSLSGDYLVRVSAIMGGGSAAKVKARRSRLSDGVARFFGGQGARAGFEYVSRMMWRDWQFRRQLIPFIPVAIAPVILLAQGLRVIPFSGRFTAVHVLPHAFGIVLFGVCTLLAYGTHHNGAWVFLLAPGGAFHGFARGVHAFLWIRIVLIPHLVLLAILAWFWGFAQAGLFVAYAVAVVSIYLGLELRLIDSVPFSKPVEASRGIFMLPLMILGGIAITIAVAVQHFLLFRAPVHVVLATLALATGAWFLTRSSLDSLAISMRFNLGQLSGESGSFYKEIDA